MSVSPSSDRPRVLTGDTPTGPLHLGHFVGSLENRLHMQDRFDCYFLVANVHALTTRAEDPQGIRRDTVEIVRDWIAVGLDPAPGRSTFLLQSEVPAIAELTWFFAMLLGYGRLMKNPTVKDEIRVKNLQDAYSFGFLMYPVGQIADILAFRPAFVPVGEDQVPHIEMTREIARRFNQVYTGVRGELADQDHGTPGHGVFPVPEATVGRVARLTGVDGKNKMSKSLNNAIYLSDTPKQVKKKCAQIFTGRASMHDPGVVEGNTLFEYHDAFNPDAARVKELKDLYAAGRIGDGQVKQELAAALNQMLDPMRQRRAKISEDDAIDILKDGTRRANVLAEETLCLAKEAARFGFFQRDLRFP